MVDNIFHISSTPEGGYSSVSLVDRPLTSVTHESGVGPSLWTAPSYNVSPTLKGVRPPYPSCGLHPSHITTPQRVLGFLLPSVNPTLSSHQSHAREGIIPLLPLWRPPSSHISPTPEGG